MPYLIANTANYFGAMPAEQVLRVRSYPVSTTEAVAIFAGDILLLTSVCTVKSITAVSTGSKPIIGVAAHYLSAGDVSSSQTMLVYDHPDQIFAICDTTSAAILSTSIFKSVAILATGCIGSSGGNSRTGRSVLALSGTETSSGGAMRVLGLHPIEGGVYSTAATGSVRKFLAQFTVHALGNASVSGTEPGAVTT